MTKAATSPPDPERETPLFHALKIVFLALFVVLVLLLGLSMVHHRFFQGQREHHNGSVGQ